MDNVEANVNNVNSDVYEEADLTAGYAEDSLDTPAGVGIDFAYAGIGQSFFINLFLIVAVFVAVKFIFAKFIFAKRNQTNINKNEAFTFSFSSIIISIALIVTSSVYGDLPENWIQATTKIVTYCGIGLVFAIFAGIIFDKFCLTKVDIAGQITKNNLAAAIVEGGNFIASSLVIMAILVWAQPLDAHGFKTLLAAFIISQLLLSATAIVWMKLFKGSGKSKGKSFQEAIEKGNVALAIDFFGKRIATALAINIATTLLAYQSMFSITMLLRDWFLVSIVSIALLQIFAFFASRVIIGGHRNASTKIAEGDIATALISASTYIAFGIILDNIV